MFSCRLLCSWYLKTLLLVTVLQLVHTFNSLLRLSFASPSIVGHMQVYIISRLGVVACI